MYGENFTVLKVNEAYWYSRGICFCLRYHKGIKGDDITEISHAASTG